MKVLMNVMQNDSLAARLAQGHDYKRSLVGDKQVAGGLVDGDWVDKAGDTVSDTNQGFIDGLKDFLEIFPWQVWVILILILLALILYRMFARGFLGWGFSSAKIEVNEEDNIYEIDFDKDMEDAVKRSDYAALVRLVYLRTLRSLDEAQRIVWRIYKTPSQYDAEVGKPAFHQMTREFVKVRYGRYPADKSLHEQMLSWQRQVLEGGAS